jgi:hypothetical protein
MLFSATQTTKVEDLAKVSLNKAPLYINVDEENLTSTVDGLEQGYIVCPSDKRFLLLFSFLKRNLKKKVIVFLSSCNSVKYHVCDILFLLTPRPSSSTILTFQCSTCTENKSNKSAQTPFLSLLTRQLVFCCALMSQRVDWTSQMWIG